MRKDLFLEHSEVYALGNYGVAAEAIAKRIWDNRAARTKDESVEVDVHMELSGAILYHTMQVQKLAAEGMISQVDEVMCKLRGLAHEIHKLGRDG